MPVESLQTGALPFSSLIWSQGAWTTKKTLLAGNCGPWGNPLETGRLEATGKGSCDRLVTQIELSRSVLLCKSLWENGAPVKSRTSNLLIRSQLLYPIELRVH